MPVMQFDKAINILRKGELTIKGEFLWGSNYTFLADVQLDDQQIQAVYKPTKGERPLWDFPASSLARREVAAYLASEGLGWHMVPPTIYLEDAPAGPGSLQFFVDHDPEYHYFNFSKPDLQRLRPVALFDLLINNADRKGSHILFDADNKLWLIDHGVCFHRENKLRTVIWDFAGQIIPEELLSDLKAFHEKLNPPSKLGIDLQELLSPEEVISLKTRTERLLSKQHFPNPHPDRRPYPWPLV
jgi:hypothetical protein